MVLSEYQHPETMGGCALRPPTPIAPGTVDATVYKGKQVRERPFLSKLPSLVGDNRH